MRITHEADYAIRIAHALATEGRMLPAREISEKTGVTLRFALKILRKMTADGIVVSHKGSCGGYALNISPEELSLGQLIECIDGPMEINHCLSGDFECTKVGKDGMCQFKKVFAQISAELRDKLYSLKMSEFTENQ